MSAETQGAETRIAEIRERVEAATPGAWRAGYVKTCQHPADEVCPGFDCTERRAIGVGIPSRLPNGRNLVIAECGRVGDEKHEAASRADAAFIAHAREDVPWLLDRLVAVERERNEARRALERIKGLGCEYVVACESFDIPDKRTCLERAEWEDDPCPSCIARAALAARPAETPEGR